jgi:hypothetical protein
VEKGEERGREKRERYLEREKRGDRKREKSESEKQETKNCKTPDDFGTAHFVCESALQK